MPFPVIPFDLIAPFMFGSMVVMLLLGFPVALTLIGHGFAFLWIGSELGYYQPAFAYNQVLRVYGVAFNDILLAIPFFTLMGMLLERSGIAEDLLASLGELLGNVQGGLAYAVIVVGTVLAATTGVIQASIIAMGVISLPTMLARGYQPALSCGVIAASGTLAQLIPPSLVLVVMAEVTGIPIFEMYERALAPGLLLAAMYLVYVGISLRFRPGLAPKVLETIPAGAARRALVALVPPTLLVAATLGSMLLGMATPTESGGFGAIAAGVLAALRGRLNLKMLREAVDATTLLSCSAMFILIGSSFFTLPFKGMDGNMWIESWFGALPGAELGFLITVNLIIFVLAFFLDFFEIAFIVLPLMMPVVHKMGIDPAWFAVLVCLTLQTSFMHPPFGVALYTLRSVAPPEVKTSSIYWGALPFIGLQLAMVAFLILKPDLAIALRPAPTPALEHHDVERIIEELSRLPNKPPEPR